jgi:hypothetical protein
MSDTVYLALGCLVPVAFLLLLATVSYLERCLVRPYGRLPTDGSDGPLPPAAFIGPYVVRMGDDAILAGFQFDTLIGHRKFPKVSIIGGIWISSDRKVILLSGSGKVLAAQAMQTWLISQVNDGTYLVTTDQNDEGDASGVDRTARLLNLPLQQLLHKHLERCATVLIRPYDHRAAYDHVVNYYDSKCQAMIRNGQARFRNEARSEWSFSLRGSAGSCLRFFRQLGGSVLQIWRFYRRPVAAPEWIIPISEILPRWIASRPSK